MSGWGPSWQPHGTRDSGSSWKPRAWWDQEASLFTTSEWHWVPVSGHDEPGDHRARSQSHDNCFTESIPLNSPLGKLLLFSFLMRFSWQSLTPVSPADLNTYLFGAYFIKGKEERTGGEIGRRWTGADEAHAFTLRRRAISWGVMDTKLAIYFKKPVCWADQQGRPVDREVLCPCTLPHPPPCSPLTTGALLQGCFQQSSSWFNSLHLHSYHGSVRDARLRHLLASELKSFSHVRLCDPIDCSLPGSSVHGIFQAIVLEWIAISFSRGSSQPRAQTRVSRIVDRRFTVWAILLPGHRNLWWG